MRMSMTMVLAAGLAVSAASIAAGQERGDGALPITNITLYRSGVGSFERRGFVQDDATVQVRFDAEQVNDILKSLVLLDLDGGRVGAVSYGSKEPLERRLASFLIDISDDPDMPELLTQLRGADVRLDLPGGPVTGKVLGVEKRRTAPIEGVTLEEHFVKVLSGAGIRSIRIADISALQILDVELERELNRALAALAEQRADRVKAVDLSFRGEGRRRAVVAYVHETPVWKTSYRLVLPEGPNGTPANERGRVEDDNPLLQGWAIVENTTDEDWVDVGLSLAAGQPVGFRMDLYEPLFVPRPLIPVPLVMGAVPKVYEGEAPRADGRVVGGGQSPFRQDQAPGSRARRAIERMEPPVAAEPELGDALRGEYMAMAQASGAEVGEQFHYRLDSPVTIERQRSAMLPIVSAPIEARRVSIYSRNDNQGHPMRGVELKNTSGVQLLPGPVSVYDGGAYAGDAQIGHLSRDETRLLAHAVDLDVNAIVRDDRASAIQGVKIVSGMVEQTFKREHRVTYAFANKDTSRARTIVVEHPKASGWDLVEPATPAGQTQALYRFELQVPPADSGDLVVKQERIDLTRVSVTDMSLPTLVSYVRQGRASQQVLDAVRKAADMQAQINLTQEQIKRLDAEVQEISGDQDRIRRNMQAIDRNSDLYATYMKRLSDQENRLQEIREQRGRHQQRLDEQRKELEEYIRGLNVS